MQLTKANATTVRLYLRNRASCGCLNDAEKNDAWLLRNFGVIDHLLRGYEAQHAATLLALEISQFAEPKK